MTAYGTLTIGAVTSPWSGMALVVVVVPEVSEQLPVVAHAAMSHSSFIQPY